MWLTYSSTQFRVRSLVITCSWMVTFLLFPILFRLSKERNCRAGLWFPLNVSRVRVLRLPVTLPFADIGKERSHSRHQSNSKSLFGAGFPKTFESCWFSSFNVVKITDFLAVRSSKAFSVLSFSYEISTIKEKGLQFLIGLTLSLLATGAAPFISLSESEQL